MGAIPEIDAIEAEQRLASGARLLDVREVDEWTAGHAPGALHIPMSELPDRIAEVPRDRVVVAVCRSGGRSARVTEFLIGNGFDAVNVAGGMKAWEAAQFPMEAEGGGAPRVA